MKIAKNINIGLRFKPFIIAELSGNHNQSLSRAYKLISLAKKAGASAVKLQTFDPLQMTLNINSKKFIINEKKNLWNKKSLISLYKKAQTPLEWHKKLLKNIKKKGMIGFSTPFDEISVDFLEKLNVPMYKIGSFELNHLPLIKKVALTKKPIIISVGMGSLKEIKEAIKIIKKYGKNKIIIMKCTSKYPANNNSLNLLTIQDLRKKFKLEVGFSDHSLGIAAAISAVSLGASVIEKHLTIKKNDSGIDSKFSSDFEEFKNLVNGCNLAWQSRGKVFYGPTNDEKYSYKRRRSIYVSSDIKKNETFNNLNVRIIRPSYGLEPKLYFKIIGKKAKRNLKTGTPLKMKDIK